MGLTFRRFEDVDITDPFFDSLKMDYQDFSGWFSRKSNEFCYASYDEYDRLDGFLYLKREDEPVNDVDPPLPSRPRIKVGTFKINPHGTRLGERFIKKIFDQAIVSGLEQIYVTIFEKHAALVALFLRYGFVRHGVKTSINGDECVLVKEVLKDQGDALASYPLVKLARYNAYLLAIKPEWHTRLLPDSILKREDSSIIQDISHTNSIHKVYLAGMDGMDNLRKNDILLIYRTTDGLGPAHYRAVVTSVCIVEEYRNIRSFQNKESFLRYCRPYSVFSLQELETFWRTKKYWHVVRFTYNFALPKRVTRGQLIEDLGYSSNGYWGFMPITHDQLKAATIVGGLGENFIVD